MSLATLQYVQDYDETFPQAFGYDYNSGTWFYSIYNCIPPALLDSGYTDVMATAYQNAIQPYAKNYQVAFCPETDATPIYFVQTTIFHKRYS